MKNNIYNLQKYMKKNKTIKNVIKTSLIIITILFTLFIIRTIMIIGMGELTSFSPTKHISGIENYDKNYFIKEYSGDLGSNLSIFPDNKKILKNAEFSSSLQTNLFDSDGYIILTSNYDKADFNNEIKRLKQISMTIHKNCKSNTKTYTNYIKYDTELYNNSAYIAIDGFKNTYEYALINENKLEITYIYLSYPKINDSKYEKYLKLDKNSYSDNDKLSKYSMYNHSFDNGKTFSEFDDCKQ